MKIYSYIFKTRQGFELFMSYIITTEATPGQGNFQSSVKAFSTFTEALELAEDMRLTPANY